MLLATVSARAGSRGPDGDGRAHCESLEARDGSEWMSQPEHSVSPIRHPARLPTCRGRTGTPSRSFQLKLYIGHSAPRMA